MAPIKLASNCISNTTTISNLFLDKYMPAANGEFVKVYLCLLRMLTDPAKGSQTLSDLADLLSVTERDVVRALRYWESIGLISVEYDSQDYPAVITLNSLSQETSSFEASAPVVSVISEAPKIPEKVAAKDYKASAKPSSETACASEKTDEEFKELIFCAEHLLGTTLGPSDMDKLLYIYETLAFPVELIEYLIDYCVSNQKRSFRYIEKVALAWHEEGILTVEAAKQHHAIHNKRIYSCMNAFGIGDRTPVATEIEMINKWHDEYGFETEVIVEAITRTIQ